MEAFADPAQARTPGRVLAAERERQGLGPADIAQRLHMSVSQVEALEADDYARLPRGTFLRGFVRNYAKMLGLPPNDVVALLAEGAPREPAPRIVVPSQNIQFGANGISNPYVRATAVAGVLIALGFAAMYWLMFVRNAPPGGTARKPVETVASAPAPVTPPPAPQVAAAPQPQTQTQTLVQAPPQTPSPQVQPQTPPAAPTKAPSTAATTAKAVTEAAKPLEAAKPAEAPKAPAGIQRVSSTESATTLKFRFKGRSWVEVKDAAGKVLLTGLNDAGSDAAVSGNPPLRVTVGNAPEVRMFLNDREFDLNPHMREAVARVTVE